MDRRKFLSEMAVFMGCSVLSLDLKAVDAALSFSGPASSESGFHMGLVSRVADIIIPETDTPSASQAGVPGYINFYLSDFLSKHKASEFISGLSATFAQGEFLSFEAAQQVRVVQALDDALNTEAENPTYKKLKELIVIGYYTSRVGATQALRYDPIPGPYKEMKLAEVGRTWL
ncbi:gluconate 2-dehydrogenase subunit 3 family protein [Microbulbifer sp. YPW1]|uniref:gluconate 2-dehydrogenase subunit 3 family protein n=1 Tax=Microbulbifer sp. YPW1 TaxID=2745199 RepID=UPI00159771F9|nr:gluconate 2-dehydrogenase subunit 3 family protein [Microbulbifer sp. YPW1]QKX17560.1 gluconate 2-dehydrogenase subunit 3 family protein [Microbulbifer sp. YPW1]